MSDNHTHDAATIKRSMSGLRRFFYLNVAMALGGLFVLGVACLYLLPNKSILYIAFAALFILALWHQSRVRKKLNCPSCNTNLYELDGIPLHAKTCSHCGVELR
jgi:hypothetical protein